MPDELVAGRGIRVAVEVATQDGDLAHRKFFGTGTLEFLSKGQALLSHL